MRLKKQTAFSIFCGIALSAINPGAALAFDDDSCSRITSAPSRLVGTFKSDEEVASDLIKSKPEKSISKPAKSLQHVHLAFKARAAAQRNKVSLKKSIKPTARIL